jgi:twitching motility protein PilT
MTIANIGQLLEVTIQRQASDLHLLSDFPPTIRVNGDLLPIPGLAPINGKDIETLIRPVLSSAHQDQLTKFLDVDFGLEYKDMARFRANVYRQMGTLAASFRLIPKKLRKLEETGLPANISNVTNLKQGLVLVTGPTGQGKTTTLAALIDRINQEQSAHIITIEDPIEFIYEKARSLVSQRELNSDTMSWGRALRATLREDPDVVLIGEMRDLETISAALTIAETGHLVFATLHTNSAAQTLDRIIDVFPSIQQSQIRSQLAAVLEVVISQRLVPTINPGRALAYEILVANTATRAIIREGKTHLIDNLIQTSAESGMVILEASLAYLLREGAISLETAQNYSFRPQVLNKLLDV